LAKAAEIPDLAKNRKCVSAQAMAERAEITMGQLEVLWRQQVAEAHPEDVSVWNGKKSQQLRLVYTKLGAETPLIISAVIHQWGSFTRFAKCDSGREDAPASPEPGYALAQAEPLINWWAQKIPVQDNGTMKSAADFSKEHGISTVSETAAPQVQPPGLVAVKMGGGQTEAELDAVLKEVTGG
jgi:hypothetical protein